MDAGQGDATLIVRSDGALILIDCGSMFNKGVVDKPIWDTLKDNGIESKGLLGLIITHPDNDHYSLVDALIRKNGIVVKNLYYGGDASHYKVDSLGAWLANPGGSTKVHALGDQHFDPNPRSELSGAGIDVRIVAANLAGKAHEAPNLNSVVVFVTCGSTTFLLMGDSFVENEREIIALDKKAGSPLATLLAKGDSVLKVGHHGSDTSTCDEWVAWAQPTAAFISSDTQLFGKFGTSTCLKTVIDRLLNLTDKAGNPVLAEGGNNNNHSYAYYDKNTQRHEMTNTTRWLYTSLVNLRDTGEKDNKGRALFTADGLSWYYTIENGVESVGPASGRSSVSKRYK
jgi:beta-lactamase superfamily II metal-dependent hydrolase